VKGQGSAGIPIDGEAAGRLPPNRSKKLRASASCRSGEVRKRSEGREEAGGRTKHAAVLGAGGSAGHAQQRSPATRRRDICSGAGRGGPVVSRRRAAVSSAERWMPARRWKCLALAAAAALAWFIAEGGRSFLLFLPSSCGGPH
jgi:hypothetical protein